ncbi:MAG TPA: Si-specific NAD(P)(+) transhydrogenase [Dongiaceae bacterium]|nr:Si-specific NAD(P)(+) transhydrogenase [Dongiaceae bacterium]
MPDGRYDLLVIGGGPAGEKGALTAAYFGKRVALIEKSPLLGGAVANTGTLPSKTLRETALALSGVRARDLYGVDLSLRRTATVADFMRHEQRVAAIERVRVLDYLSRARVEVIRGCATFADPHTLEVQTTTGPKRFAADTILIATGSSPRRPGEFAFEDPRIADSDEVLRLERMPRRLAVIGAGVIGSEYACTFAALGVEVHLVDGHDRLLPFLDGEVSEALGAGMRRLGVTFHWNESVAACAAPAGDGDADVHLKFASGAGLEVDTVLVASGRVSNTAQLGLEAAGVALGERGVVPVDAQFRTNVPHILAAGDVIGFPALAATSMEQARAAVCFAFDLPIKKEVARFLPYGIYTIPEASMVGETEESLREKKIPYVVGRALYRENARGSIVGDRDGFLKLLFKRDDYRLLGVHAIGEQASELVHVGLVALHLNAGWELFHQVCFNYPTLGWLYQRAAYDAAANARPT